VLISKGASSVRACATHGILSGKAFDNINNSYLTEVMVTDTIPLHPAEGTDTSKITVISMAEVFASIIRKVYYYEPVSTEFIF
jgi:ribose-phosphate pyrophosphokinase